MKLFAFFLFLPPLLACHSAQPESMAAPVPQSDHRLVHAPGKTIDTRFRLPQGYTRIAVPEGSFGRYLRQLPLHPDGAVVHLYNGSEKPNNGIYAAVVNMDIGSRNLQQCADAVMRLRAEYLYKKGTPEKIHFNFTSGFRAGFGKWMEGYRIVVNNNNAAWMLQASPDKSYRALRNYLEMVFSYAGTLSLEKELKPVPLHDMRPGDVLIHGGSPGHAVIVVDMAENAQGKKIYLLAQSYMPAQEIQVLENPSNDALSPWYALPEEAGEIVSPEWVFPTGELRRFPED